jgi:SAM-dependent methyltransferase
MSELIDTTAPNSARVWNYWLGGKDHYPADARIGQYCASFYPGMTVLARSCRYFTARVIGYLASTGIHQFLDLGCGLPAQAGYTHQIAQAIVSDAHVVYADHDPLVLAHARALMTCGPPGTTSHLHADLNHPAALLTAARRMLDFTEPIAVLAMNVFGHLGDPAHDDDQAAHTIVAQLVAGLPPGSYLAIDDRTSNDPLHNLATRAYNASGALQFVREWATLHRDEIVANWERARRNEPLLGIDPLA